MKDNKVSTFKERLLELISESKKSAAVIANEFGVSKQSLSSWTTGVRSPKTPTVDSLASYFGVTLEWLLGYDVPKYNANQNHIPPYKNISPIIRKRVPLLGEIAAGVPIYAEEDHEAYVTADADLKCDFALTVKGESMIGAHIFNGDIVFIRKQPNVRDGQIAAVVIDDEATLKRVYHQRDGVTLVSENPEFPPMPFREEDAVNVRILGLAVALHHKII